MKKGIASIFLVFYFAATCGIVINLHYCMDRIDSVQLGSVKSEFCNACGMHMDEAMDCCQNEVKVVKLQLDQQVKGLHYSFHETKYADDFFAEINSRVPETYNSAQHFIAHSPPLNKHDVYLLNCVFRL